MLHPMVKDFYMLIEKHYGKPIGPIRTRADGNDIADAAMAAVVIWGMMATRGCKVAAVKRIGTSRATMYKHIAYGKYLQEYAELLNNKPRDEYYEVKSLLGLESDA